MVTFEPEAVRRVREQHRKAETDLKAYFSGPHAGLSFGECQSRMTDYAVKLLDADAAEMIHVVSGPTLRNELDRVKNRLIEKVMPDKSLTRAGLMPLAERQRIRVHHVLDKGLILEESADGSRTPARSEIQAEYAQHGLWENFVPHEGLRFVLRFSGSNEEFRVALDQALERRIFFWLGQVEEEYSADPPQAGVLHRPLAPSVPRRVSKRNVYDTALGQRLKTHLGTVETQEEFALESGVSVRTLRSVASTFRASRKTWEAIRGTLDRSKAAT